MRHNAFLTLTLCCLLASACNATYEHIDVCPAISPDYCEVTIPRSIAPVSFVLKDGGKVHSVLWRADGQQYNSRGALKLQDWRRLCSEADSIEVTVNVSVNGKRVSYRPFVIYLSNDEIDSHIAYRLIEPGYVTWNEMGIYCRELGSYEEREIIRNTATDKNCMNCHSFCNRDHTKMMFHMRAKNGGTYLIQGSLVEKLNTKTDSTISAVVYPYWHPDGKHIAFSVNDIMQSFHSTKRNRVEVFDGASDVVVYNIKNDCLFSAPFLRQEEVLETFPSFSPDGRFLYYCSSARQVVPQDYEKIRYSICRVGFSPENDSFGEKVDTLFSAKAEGGSAVFPRVSPDGRFLLLTVSEYGCFPIWHKDADLVMIDLESGRRVDMSAANSADVDSYHSWSSNSRWIIFSSRRMDGLYTRPYISHIDANGKASKPFALPQREGQFYDRFLKSYNIPEFVDGFPEPSESEIATVAVESKGKDLKYRVENN